MITFTTTVLLYNYCTTIVDYHASIYIMGCAISVASIAHAARLHTDLVVLHEPALASTCKSAIICVHVQLTVVAMETQNTALVVPCLHHSRLRCADVVFHTQ